jgi:S-adenosylmethionine:diacylglycerol 3-amino-3-carboxypropyl transferase
MDNCQASFHDYGYPDNVEARRWQTPPRGAPGHKPSFQNYRDIQGYASVTYSPSRQRAHVKINVFTRVTPTSLLYRFAASSEVNARDTGVDMFQLSTDNTFTVDHDFKDSLSVVVYAPQLNNATLVLDRKQTLLPITLRAIAFS